MDKNEIIAKINISFCYFAGQETNKLNNSTYLNGDSILYLK